MRWPCKRSLSSMQSATPRVRSNYIRFNLGNYSKTSKMSYSDFSLEKVKRTFELTTLETVDLFGDIPELECSALLTEILRYNAPLAFASNSEKARSEMIISPRGWFRDRLTLEGDRL